MKSTINQDDLIKKDKAKESLQHIHEYGKDESLHLTDEHHATVMKDMQLIESPTNELIRIVKNG